MHFVNLGEHSVNLDHVCCVCWCEDGSATVGLTSGDCKTYSGEDAKAIAAAVGKKEEKHKAPAKESSSHHTSKTV